MRRIKKFAAVAVCMAMVVVAAAPNGSLAAKANMVREFNERNNKKN